MKKLTSLVLAGLLSCSPYTASTLRDGNIQTQGERPIEYSPKVADILTNLYANHPREFPLCMEGEKRGNVYYVDNLVIPHIFYTDSVGTNYNGNDCKRLKRYIGMIHNHNTIKTEVHCNAGLTDMIRFTSKKEEKAKLEAIVCHASLYSNYVNITTIFKELLSDSLVNRLRFLGDSLKEAGYWNRNKK